MARKGTRLEEKGKVISSEISEVHGSPTPTLNETDRMCRHVAYILCAHMFAHDALRMSKMAWVGLVWLTRWKAVVFYL